MKITILDGAVENPGDLSWDALAALGDLTVYDYTAPEEILSRIGDAPIILTNKTPITRQTMDECPNLRYIGVLATGFNVIDIAAAKEKGMNVWCYTGFTLEELLRENRADRMRLLSAVDVLVDGPFRSHERSLDLLYRGSKNQRLIDMPATLKGGTIRLYAPPEW